MIFPDSAQNIVYSYDDGVNGKGRLTGVSHLSGSDLFGYDALGNIKTVVNKIDNPTYPVSYDYAPSGVLETMTYPSGLTASYQTDADGQITGVTDGDQTLISDINYLPFGPAESAVFGDNLFIVTRDHNQRYQLKRITADLTAAPEPLSAAATTPTPFSTPTTTGLTLSNVPFAENPEAGFAAEAMNNATFATTPADILSGKEFRSSPVLGSQKNPVAKNPFGYSQKSAGKIFFNNFYKSKKYPLLEGPHSAKSEIRNRVGPSRIQ